MKVENTGLNALASPLSDYLAGEELFLGALFGIDEHGKAVLADNTSSKKIYAVGVVTKGDFVEAGAGYKDEYTGAKRVNNKRVPAERFAVLFDPEDVSGLKKAGLKVGQAVYLGKKGKLEAKKPSDSSAVQKVGYVADLNQGIKIAIMIDSFDVE